MESNSTSALLLYGREREEGGDNCFCHSRLDIRGMKAHIESA